MFVHIHWSIIWMSVFMTLLSIDKSQSSVNNLQLYSETEEIIEYAYKIFGTINEYRPEHGNIIEKLKRIANETKIEELMNRIPPNILDRYSCKGERGLINVESMLQFFDAKYTEFEKYLPLTNSESLREKFIMNIYMLHDANEIDNLIDEGLKWDMVNDSWSDYELFKTLVDLHNPMEERSCRRGQSLNQYIYELYNSILYRFIKIYGIVMFSYSSLLLDNDVLKSKIGDGPAHQFFDKARLEKGLQKAKQHFETNFKKLTDNALLAVKRASRNILSQDPPRHIKGTTYTSLDYFLQGYVTDQKYLSPSGTCTPSCSQYTNTIHYNHIYQRLFPQNSICTGRIRACMATAVEKMCLAPTDSTRRYNGLLTVPSPGRDFQYWGNIFKNCSVSTAIDVKLFYSDCKVCHCTCDMENSPKSIRYIDLRSARSQTIVSFVVTGIRFRVINRILTLQIQEGELKNGKILPESLIWVEIDEFKNDYDSDPMIFKLDYNHRLLDLADITLPNNYAVTLVEFTVVGNVIRLQIGGHPIVHGELNRSDLDQIIEQSEETISSRPVFHPDGMDIPIRENIKNSKVSEPNKFLLQFETSDWKNDAGQNVIPFIDLQEVVTNPPAPVAGVGIHVRYGDTSGGFLAPKLISIDNEMKFRQFEFPVSKTNPAPDDNNNSEKTHSFLRIG